MSTTAKKPRKRQRAEQYPATGDRRDAPHVGRAARGCACMSCSTHRMLERQATRDRAYEVLNGNEVMLGTRPQFGRSATSELIDALTKGL